MRLVYLGTPEMAVPPLRALVAAGHDVALVITRADRRRGRGGATSPSPVKAAAVELGVPVSHDVDDVLTAGAELGVVVAFGRIIKPHVLAALPMVNVHFSLLPRWRGAAPVERALLAGDTETGVCIMDVEEGLDTGGVLRPGRGADRAAGPPPRSCAPNWSTSAPSCSSTCWPDRSGRPRRRRGSRPTPTRSTRPSWSWTGRARRPSWTAGSASAAPGRRSGVAASRCVAAEPGHARRGAGRAGRRCGRRRSRVAPPPHRAAGGQVPDALARLRQRRPPPGRRAPRRSDPSVGAGECFVRGCPARNTPVARNTRVVRGR